LEDVIDISHPASPDVIRAALAKAAESGFALTICAGFNLADTVRKVARTYPAARFGLIDSIVEEPNVVSVLFMEKDVSFLAGVAAGLQAKKDGKTTVGLIAGMDNPVIRRFRAGFVQGVKAVFPTCTILVDFAGAFDRPEKGRWLATTQFDKGAWVIYTVAGISGNGIFQEAIARAERGDRRWVIGVDTDQ
jgi:basic membrane protein A